MSTELPASSSSQKIFARQNAWHITNIFLGGIFASAGLYELMKHDTSVSHRFWHVCEVLSGLGVAGLGIAAIRNPNSPLATLSRYGVVGGALSLQNGAAQGR